MDSPHPSDAPVAVTASPSHPSSSSPAPRLPAEWEEHEGTWIAWPHQKRDWPGKFGPIPWVFVEILRLLARTEKVFLLVQDRAHKLQARKMLEIGGVDLERVEFVRKRTDRCWLRDSGPMFVRDAAGAPTLVDWKFNAWAKYPNFRDDNRVPRKIARRLGWERIVPRTSVAGDRLRVVLEGGAIDVNGQGTLLTTEECLLSPVQERNPGLDRAGLEAVFAETLGIRKVLWLGNGIAGDDTHGHVDDLARFVNPRTIVCVVENNPQDPNYAATQDNWERLAGFTDQDGLPIQRIALPMPRPVIFDDTRLPASYANFYIANGQVLVPTFNDPADRNALAILAGLFPDREVVGVHALDLVWGLGTLHCLTRDQPRLDLN